MSNLLDKSTILEKLYSDDFKVFVQKFKLDNIMVFGSLLTEEFSDESDVDIALLGDEAIALDDILEIELFLEDFLGRAIDVVDLRSSTLDIFIKINILNSCKSVYSLDKEKFEKFCDEVHWIYKENEDYFYFR
ncbi:MAG: nucleotidyltransferase domain-containing protein, partial [Clostridium sp.]